jgi:hypothetical protein
MLLVLILRTVSMLEWSNRAPRRKLPWSRFTLRSSVPRHHEQERKRAVNVS